jgi:hypothetical protein
MSKTKYIISVGTSQLDALDPQKNPPLYTDQAHIADWRDFYDRIRKNSSTDTNSPQFLRDKDAWIKPIGNLLADKISPLCEERYASLEKKIRNETNPFGAEISLLTIYEKDVKTIDPALDEFYLITSRTQAGVFAAELLQYLLIYKWGIKTTVHIEEICHLSDAPGSEETVNQAMEQLAQKIKNIIKASLHNNKSDYGHIFMISGGFKSIIPCLTLFSLFFGIKMYYVFEKSIILQALHPSLRLGDPAIAKQWRQIIDQMQSIQFMEQAAPYFKEAFKFRQENPLVDFSTD